MNQSTILDIDRVERSLATSSFSLVRASVISCKNIVGIMLSLLFGIVE